MKNQKGFKLKESKIQFRGSSTHFVRYVRRTFRACGNYVVNS